MTSVLVASVAQIPPGSVLGVQIAKKSATVIGRARAEGPPDTMPVAVIHSADDEWFAMGDQCPHRPYLLSGGALKGCEPECPGHGSRFNPVTGHAINPPAQGSVPTYPVTVTGDQVFIELSEPDADPSGRE